MNRLQELYDLGYSILNVRTEKTIYKKENKTTKEITEIVLNAKMPCIVKGTIQLGFKGWEQSELTDTIFTDGLGFGLRTGKQKNGKFILSLDFDINGEKDENGKNTKALYNEFKQIREGLEEGGEFTGGTTGNKNVLIDYTNAKSIMELKTKGKNSKVQIYGLEIFRGNQNQQVIPPTATECKITKNKNTRGWINDKPFLELNDANNDDIATIKWLYDVMVKADGGNDKREQKELKERERNEKKEMKPVKEKMEKPKKEKTETEEDKKDRLINETNEKRKKELNMEVNELLFTIIKNERLSDGAKQICRDDWLKICGSLLSNGYEKQIWLDWTALWSSRYGCKNKSTSSDLWENFLKQGVRDVSIYTLYSLAKKYNPAGYAVWKKTSYLCNGICFGILCKGENDIAKYISDEVRNRFVFTGEKWYEYNDKKNIWELNNEIDCGYVCSLIQKKIDFEITHTEDMDLIDAFKKMRRVVSTGGVNSTILKYLKSYLKDLCFEDKLDLNIGEIAFNDGMYDMKTKQFRDGLLQTDYLTGHLDINFRKGERETTPQKRAFVEEVVKKIMNNNDAHATYFKSWIGYSFIGRPELVKGILMLMDMTAGGKGDNGKSLMFDVLGQIATYYYYKTSSDFIEEKEASKKHKRLSMMKRKRIVYIDELGDRVNSKLIKEIANGKEVESEIMFGTCEQIDIYWKLILSANFKMEFETKNCGAMGNRYNQISCGSHFITDGTLAEDDATNLRFVADTGLYDKLVEDYAFEVLMMFLDEGTTYLNFKGKDYLKTICPAEFVKDGKKAIQSNDKFAKWFEENIEPAEGFKLGLHEMMSCGLEKDKIVEALKRNGIAYDRQLSCGYDNFGKQIRGGIKNYRFIDEENL